jgi:site-specific DNA-methyltransferase (adenine-specific)
MGGWSRAQVSQYAMLNKICKEAWETIATSFQNTVAEDDDDAVAEIATGVAKSAFSENLLRNILDLHPSQQVELCGYLAKGKDKKGHAYNKAKFKQDAIWYRAFNILWDLADKQLSAAIPDPVCREYLAKVQGELKAHSEYTDEWLKNKAPGDKFNKLIQAQIDDWQQKNNVKIIVKDIRLLTADDIASESVDCIITDPPYPKGYIELFDDLGALAARVLKPGGSLVVMTGQLYLPSYIELLSKHLTYHWLLAYTTPGGQAVQVWNQEVNTFWKPLLWFVKDQRDARWVSDVINTPVNANDKQHHHWGQSEFGMSAIVDKFTNPGDVVLDPFLGGGTTGLVCKESGRKFIGVEIDENEAKKAIARIHGGKG